MTSAMSFSSSSSPLTPKFVLEGPIISTNGGRYLVLRWTKYFCENDVMKSRTNRELLDYPLQSKMESNSFQFQTTTLHYVYKHQDYSGFGECAQNCSETKVNISITSQNDSFLYTNKNCDKFNFSDWVKTTNCSTSRVISYKRDCLDCDRDTVNKAFCIGNSTKHEECLPTYSNDSFQSTTPIQETLVTPSQSKNPEPENISLLLYFCAGTGVGVVVVLLVVVACRRKRLLFKNKCSEDEAYDDVINFHNDPILSQQPANDNGNSVTCHDSHHQRNNFCDRSQYTNLNMRASVELPTPDFMNLLHFGYEVPTDFRGGSCQQDPHTYTYIQNGTNAYANPSETTNDARLHRMGPPIRMTNNNEPHGSDGEYLAMQPTVLI